MRNIQRRKLRRSSVFSDRKGNAITDTALVAVILIVMFIVCLFGYFTFTNINSDLQADLDMGNESKAIAQDINDRMPSTWDAIIVTALIFFWILVIVASFMIDSHPIFFAISIIILIFVLIAVGLIGNSYEELAADATISAYTASFPMSHWIFTHYLPVIIGVAFSILAVLYMKNRFVG